MRAACGTGSGWGLGARNLLDGRQELWGTGCSGVEGASGGGDLFELQEVRWPQPAASITAALSCNSPLPLPLPCCVRSLTTITVQGSESFSPPSFTMYMHIGSKRTRSGNRKTMLKHFTGFTAAYVLGIKAKRGVLFNS